MKPIGDGAVEAIGKYKGVVATLEQSVVLALEANRTIAEVMAMLQTVSTATLEKLSAQSLRESQRLLNDIRRRQVSSEGTRFLLVMYSPSPHGGQHALAVNL